MGITDGLAGRQQLATVIVTGEWHVSITINGEQVEASVKSLSDYLKEAGYDTRGIAVERNGEVIPRSRYDSTILNDGDHVEIVHCVAGG